MNSEADPDSVRLSLKPATGCAVGGIEEILAHGRMDHEQVKDAIKFVNVFFPFSTAPMLLVDEGGIRLLIENGAIPCIIDDSQSLLNLLPNLQTWVDQWAASTDRSPRLDPAWATQKGIGQASVHALANAIRAIARAESVKLRFLGDDGALTSLEIPPKASLCVPQADPGPRLDLITVGDGRWFECFSSPSGAKFLRPTASRLGEWGAGMPVLRVDPRKGKRKAVLRRARLRPFGPGADRTITSGESDEK